MTLAEKGAARAVQCSADDFLWLGEISLDLSLQDKHLQEMELARKESKSQNAPLY